MMKTATFKEWTLTQLDQAFGLSQVLLEQCQRMQEWENQASKITISDTEKEFLLDLQEPLTWGGQAWNEAELENKFISPLIMYAKVDDRQIGYFLERPLSGKVGNYMLSGIVDGMIAKGFRDPTIPYFCMHEYKRYVDNSGYPDAQALAAMLVARELNDNRKAIYGLYIVGINWNFIVLETNNYYCISQVYNSTKKDIFEIFAMIKSIKAIIKSEFLDEC